MPRIMMTASNGCIGAPKQPPPSSISVVPHVCYFSFKLRGRRAWFRGYRYHDAVDGFMHACMEIEYFNILDEQESTFLLQSIPKLPPWPCTKPPFHRACKCCRQRTACCHQYIGTPTDASVELYASIDSTHCRPPGSFGGSHIRKTASSSRSVPRGFP